MSFRVQFVAGFLLLAPAFAGTNKAIIVSAPRLDDLDLMDVAVAADVTVIEREAIEQSGAASVPELLQSEANVLIRSTTGNGNDGQISMRGFGENSHLRTLVLVDGHKINRPDMGGIEWQSIPVSNIERIEVIRGGQNVLYGNHALSGVVKITTKRGDDAGTQVTGTMGSFGYRSGSASYGETVGDVDFLVGISSYWYDGYRSNSTSYATTVNAGAGWFVNDTDTLTLRASGGKSYIQYPGSLSYTEMQDDPTQSSNFGNQFSDDQSALATLLYETERSWGAARVNTGLSFRDRDVTFDGIYTVNQQIGASVAPRARFGSEDDFWMTGLDFNYDRLDVENYRDPARNTLKSRAELSRITTAPYLFAQRTFLGKTILNGGARYEYAGTDNHNVAYKFDGTVDPTASFDGLVEKQGWAAELSVSHKLSEQLDFFAGYDRVYRYPALDETASYQGFPLSDPLNEDLDPEHGNNLEVGSRYSNPEWMASLTAFYLTLDNEIGYDPVTNLNVNIGATRRVGIEAELGWHRAWYGASTRWTFVDARFDGGENDGNRVPLVPWAYGVMSAWVEPVPEFRLTAIYTYVSEQFQGSDEANERQKMDAYGRLGLRANVAMSDHVNLYFSVHNLLDEIYASSAYFDRYYPGSGRSFRMGITWVY